MEVRVSGPVLASLFLELANGKGDLEGILLGDTTGRTVSTISDSSSQQLSFERIATIQGFVPQNKVFSFYDNVGHIDKKRIKVLLGQNKENVIGWYKYRRNSQPLVSMRERHVHHNLIKEINFTPSKEFLFIVFTASTSTVMSVHSFNYSIVSSSGITSPFDYHELKIINLGDTSHSEYRLQPETIRTPSKLFENITDSYREDFMEDGCLKQPLSMHSMCISIMTKMKDLLTEVSDSESTVGVMTEEVEALREKLEQKKKERNLKLEKKRLLEQNEVETAQLIQITPDTDKKEKQAKTDRLDGQVPKSKHRHSKSHAHSYKREVEQMDTSTSYNLIDFHTGADSSVDQPPSSRALNGGIRYQNIRKKMPASQPFDDDETQDYSLPEEKRNQDVSGVTEQSVLDSMSPTY